MYAARLPALAVVALLAMPSGAADAEREAKRLEAVEQRLRDIDKWLGEAGEQLAEEQQALADADRRIAETTQGIRASKGRVDAAGESLAALDAQGDRLGALRRTQTAGIASQVRAAWRLSGRDPAKALLGQEDPADAERLMRYHGYVAEALGRSVAALRGTLGELDENRQRVRRQRADLAASRTALEERHAALAAQRQERGALIAKLQEQVADKQRERQRLGDDRERLRKLIEKLRREAAARTKAAARAKRSAALAAGADGNLPWPVAGRALHRFGEARGAGVRWQGVYIAAPAGTDVRAVAGGAVVFAQWLRGFGLLAIVEHDDSWMSLYGNADALYKKAGERVEAGEVIAAVGQSGGQAEAGLYFEIREDGKPTDPQAWLQRRAAQGGAGR